MNRAGSSGRALPAGSRSTSALAAALCLTALGAPALAAPPAPSELAVDAFPVIGAGATMAQGWSEIAVRIQNKASKPTRGQVEVAMSRFGRGGSGKVYRATAPFSVGGGAAVHVRVPAQVASYGDLTVEVRGEDGALVHENRFPSSSQSSITLLDVSETSRLRGVVQDAVISPLVGASGARSAATLSVASPKIDPATGDPILPDRAALYAAADAVLLRSDTLARLGGAELDALAGWVLAGGTVAVAVARPEDLRHPTLAAFAGGALSRQGAAAVTLAELALPPPSGTLSPSAKLIPSAARPAADVVETLSGYTGGNLRPSLYGASATYGLGEVHLLAFDPTRKPAVDDPWVQARVVDLARRAHDRQVSVAFRPGQETGTGSYQRVRQQLDPNESSRWAIGAAALLLCAYAAVAGPVNFALATKAGKPLRALRWLPLIAAAAFLLVVGIGVVAKGVTGRARHLTVVEAGAGMGKATARRFRGFYASRAKELTVRTTDGSSVVSTAVLPEYADQADHLVVDREGARLVDVAALPWQTVVVREDGFASIGDGIAIVPEGEGGLVVVNRTGRDLRAAVLRAADGKAYYFPRIRDGERATPSAGQALSATAAGASWEGMLKSPSRSGLVEVHRLNAHGLGGLVDADAPGLADAWRAAEEALAGTTDWFPDGVPTLVGQLDGGEGRLSDSGLRLETDRVLVRVVGWGGRK